MPKETKNSIVTYFVRHRKIWDIQESLAVEVTKEIADSKFERFSTTHYQISYLILKAKLDTIKDPVAKIAYLDCLRMNYCDLGSDKINSALDIVGSIASGGYLGISIFSGKTDVPTLVITASILLVFQLIKAYNLCNRRWGFYQMVISQLKSDLLKCL